MIAAASVVIGVIFSVISVLASTRNFSKSRQAQLFMQFHSTVYSKDFLADLQDAIATWTWDDIDDYIKKYGRGANPEAYFILFRTITQFDSVGTLVRNKLTDIKFMPRGIALMVIGFWEKFSPISSELEAVWGNVDIFGEIEYLYNKVKQARILVAKD